MRKNDLVQIKITDYTQEGLGIGRAQEMAVFVKDTVIGDFAEVKITKMNKTYAFGRLERILHESPDRITAPCPSARACGGCQIQMMNYPAQLRFKEEKVVNCLVRIGGFSGDSLPMEPIIGMTEPWNYRNKSQFPVGRTKEGQLTAGFYAGRTHNIIAQPDCRIGIAENEEILNAVLSHMKRYGIGPYEEATGSGLVRHVMIRKGFATGQIMVCLVVNGRSIPHQEELAERLFSISGVCSVVLNINTRRTNVILGTETVSVRGNDYIEDQIGPVRYRISARSFYQVNPVQTQRLYAAALEFAQLTGRETVWDLYCGIGTISLFLARKAGKVYGVEIVPEAIEDARRNARLNGIENAEFFVGKAEEILPDKYEKEQICSDVIVVDPPRKGCDEKVIETILQMKPKRIVYVSCDPATLARDLKELCAGGYKLQKIQPCDMFPHSVHIETIVLLQKLNS